MPLQSSMVRAAFGADGRPARPGDAEASPSAVAADADILAYAADLIAELQQLTAPSGNRRLAELLAEAQSEARRGSEAARN